MKRELQCPAYLRFVDDALLFADDKAILWEWLHRITLRLGQCRLTIHGGAHPRPVTEGIPFLGFTVSPEHRRVKRRKAIHFQRKLRQLATAYNSGVLPFKQLNATVQGWINHVRYGNTIGLRKAIFRQVKISRA